jgi:hypothetical protein
MYHAAMEAYDHARAQGLSHDDSVAAAVLRALKASWNKTLGRPWASDDPNKNRKTLLVTVIDYLDSKAANDVLKTIILANGRPAVELHFQFDLGIRSSASDEAFVSCGYFDRLADFNGQPVIVDHKTSKYQLDASFWSKFTPHVQFSNYLLAAQVTFKVPARELVVNAAQVAATFSRFDRGIVARDEAQLREFHADFGFHLREMERCAVEGYWPQRPTACGNYRGCEFRRVCSKSPASRESWLASDFTKRLWNPLAQRTDI